MSHYIVMPTVEAAIEWGDYFNATDLTANGFRVRIEGDRLVFPAGAIDYMQSWSPEDDGVVTEEAGQLMMWLAGDPYAVHRES